MTKSEIRTEVESKKVFLPEFVNYSIKYKDEKGEDELCDCLLEFQNYYTVIEVKERDSHFLDKENNKWFRKTIEKTGVDRIVKFYSLLKRSNELRFYDKNNKTLLLDDSFYVFPIIVFDNPCIKDYKRVIFCRRINRYINVFSIEDFNEAFDTLLIPYEINLYLEFRIACFKKDENFLKARLVLGEYKDKILLWGGGIQSESDLAQFYYASRSDVDEPNSIAERLSLFNSISNHIRNSLDANTNDEAIKKEMLSFVNSVDINVAYSIAKMWDTCLKRIKENDGSWPPFSMKKDKSGLLLITKPSSFSDEEFSNYCSNLVLMFAYSNRLSTVYHIGFYSVDGAIATAIGAEKYGAFEDPDQELECELRKYRDLGIRF